MVGWGSLEHTACVHLNKQFKIKRRVWVYIWCNRQKCLKATATCEKNSLPYICTFSHLSLSEVLFIQHVIVVCLLLSFFFSFFPLLFVFFLLEGNLQDCQQQLIPFQSTLTMLGILWMLKKTTGTAMHLTLAYSGRGVSVFKHCAFLISSSKQSAVVW